MPPLRLPQRKKIRLSPGAYRRAETICSVTIAVRERARVLEDDRLAAAAVRLIGDLAGGVGVLVHAFCVMPDHVHLVLQPGEGEGIVAFVGRFKSRVLREAWTLGLKGSFWQHGFYDHFLRAEEDLDKLIDYALQNPVRAGLVEHASEYAYSGARGGTR